MMDELRRPDSSSAPSLSLAGSAVPASRHARGGRARHLRGARGFLALGASRSAFHSSPLVSTSFFLKHSCESSLRQKPTSGQHRLYPQSLHVTLTREYGFMWTRNSSSVVASPPRHLEDTIRSSSATSEMPASLELASWGCFFPRVSPTACQV